MAQPNLRVVVLNLLRRAPRTSEPLTQHMIDGSGEHRKNFSWTLSQVRNSVFSAGYIKSQAGHDFLIAEVTK